MRLGSAAQHCWLTLAVASPWWRVSLQCDQRTLDCGTGGLRQNEGGGEMMEVGWKEVQLNHSHSFCSK